MKLQAQKRKEENYTDPKMLEYRKEDYGQGPRVSGYGMDRGSMGQKKV